MRRLFWLPPALFILAACAPAISPTGGDGVILPEQAQRVIDAYTATARVEATRIAQVTATDQSSRATSTTARLATLDALAGLQTESALALTQGAGAAMATDSAAVKTAAVQQSQVWSTPTAAAVRTQQAAAAVERTRQQAQAQDVAEFWQSLRFILLALLIVGGLTAIVVVAIDRISAIRIARLRERAAIAREAFRILTPDHWAGWEPEGGYQVHPLPPLIKAAPTVVENAPTAPHQAYHWHQAIRLFAWWGNMHGFGMRDLGPAGKGVVTDPDWRVLSKLLKDAGVLTVRRIPGQHGSVTAWADDWSFVRLADDLSERRLALPFPSDAEVPKVAFTVPTQHHEEAPVTQQHGNTEAVL